jgi:hypothetical protein
LITVYLKNRVRYIHFHEEAPQEDWFDRLM